MTASVYFWNLRTSRKAPYDVRLRRLLKRVGLNSCFEPGHFVAVKVHFGEKGATGFLSPLWLKPFSRFITKAGGRAFFTDTNTLYVGQRGEAVSHSLLAAEHGFDPNILGAPVLIADGLRSSHEQAVPFYGRHIQTAYIAGDIAAADTMLVASHFKGHDLAGFGGALKNIAMGCASRRGKLQQHSGLAPRVNHHLCTGCGQCLPVCPAGALTIDSQSKTLLLDTAQCIGCAACILACRHNALQVDWTSSVTAFQERMAEYAAAVVGCFSQPLVYVNFVTQVTPGCDCIGHSDAPICPDIGILASRDPVALDQASCDLVNQSPALTSSALPESCGPGDDKFQAVHPETNGGHLLAYAAELGLGTRGYDLHVVS
ncbi:DUF362 domain-containing protein [Desulfohalobium retbaense]|uniref:4Fe-4S ferredoxin iron-sulfur binding domain protein n=1 Tax=Desulfohalobium retbaense (strain ATCC 49708 / DSM 5692 / JCM 16813 / HR100) TaxID=485915 RepID=C8X5Q2_DESRD|nr:DUF362 domain-containing protein [Desulfohalobium retbaense]ACV69749.1 4Fe-4S ferredoxin iron-sulfur binding domain protein [Desulfohalobium retbaense DSM 5692]